MRANNLGDVLAAYVDTVQHDRILSLLERQLISAGLLQPNAYLGTGDTRDEVKFSLQKQGSTLNAEQVAAALSGIKKAISVFHDRHQRKVNSLFWGILIFLFLTVGLVAISILSNPGGLSIPSLGTGLISAVLLPLYQIENKKLRTAEEHLQRLELLQAQLNLLALIPDEAAKVAAYQKVITALVGNGGGREGTVIHNYGAVEKQLNVQKHQGDVHT